jgi:hypothetical protein
MEKVIEKYLKRVRNGNVSPITYFSLLLLTIARESGRKELLKEFTMEKICKLVAFGQLQK